MFGLHYLDGGIVYRLLIRVWIGYEKIMQVVGLYVEGAA